MCGAELRLPEGMSAQLRPPEVQHAATQTSQCLQCGPDIPQPLSMHAVSETHAATAYDLVVAGLPLQEEHEEGREAQLRQRQAKEEGSDAHIETDAEGEALKGAKPHKRKEGGAPGWSIRQALLRLLLLQHSVR